MLRQTETSQGSALACLHVPGTAAHRLNVGPVGLVVALARECSYLVEVLVIQVGEEFFPVYTTQRPCAGSPFQFPVSIKPTAEICHPASQVEAMSLKRDAALTDSGTQSLLLVGTFGSILFQGRANRLRDDQIGRMKAA